MECPGLCEESRSFCVAHAAVLRLVCKSLF